MNNLTKMTLGIATIGMAMTINLQDASACGIGSTDFKTTIELNVRTQPNTSTGVVVKKLPKGSVVRPVELSEDKQWVKIDAGWVVFNYLEEIVHTHGEHDTQTNQNTQINQNSQNANNSIKLDYVAYQVTTTSLNARTGAGMQYDVYGTFREGQVLMAYEQKGNWLKVEDGHINDVWVHKSCVKLYKDSQSINNNQTVTQKPSTSFESQEIDLVTLEITADFLNVRETPSASGKLVGFFNKGDEVISVEKSGKWYAVTLKSGEKGWINGGYTKKLPMSMNATLGGQDGILVDTPNREDRIRTVSVGKGKALNVMFGNFPGSGLKAKLIDGNKVEVLSESNGVAHVKYNHYIKGVARVAFGYVASAYLK